MQTAQHEIVLAFGSAEKIGDKAEKNTPGSVFFTGHLFGVYHSPIIADALIAAHPVDDRAGYIYSIPKGSDTPRINDPV
jgi:hypothetical protein